MEFMEQQLTSDLSAQSESDVAVVHLPIREEVKETAEIATTEEATDITSGDIKVETLADATAEVGGTEKVEFTSDSFSVYAVITYQDHEPGTDTFKSVLGDAVNFGIVSEEIHVSESETNFAVKRLVASGQSGNDMTNPVEQTFIVSEADISQVVSYNGEPPKFKIKGEKAYFMVPYNTDAKDKIWHQDGKESIIFDDAYSSDYLEQIVDDMLTYTRAASADLKTREDNAVIETDKNDKDRYMVDLTKEGYDVNGTYYVTLSDDEYKNISQDQKLYIYKTSGQTIVFNVPQSGDVSIHKFMVSTDGAPAIGSDTLAGNKKDPVARTIIWNFENADNVYTGGGVVGVFIAGKENATWHNMNTSAGWIAFPTVKITAEFHNTYDEIQQISGAVQLEAYKNIDGEPAKASGFKFKLAVLQLGKNTGWRDLEVISNEENSPHDIIFDSVTFGGDKNYTGDGLYQYVDLENEGDHADFVFVIDEVEGTTDSQGNVYEPDNAEYFAFVTVTLQKLNEHTNTLYYKVSQPVYYTNFARTQLITDSDRPVFNNTTKKGSVGLKIYKYLNGADPEKYQFTFTVRKLVQTGTYISDGTTYPACHLETVKNNLTNNGKNISDELEYTSKDYVTDEHGSKHVYYVITENPGSVNSDGIQVINDTDYIFVRIDNPETDNPIVNYYKVNADNINCQRIEDTSVGYKYIYVKAICNGSTGFAINPENYAKDLAFYNTGTSMLRIHKMVVNDFGSDFVRDNVNSILNSVKFRITNNTTGNYIILRGFAAAEGTLSSNYLGEKAKEYDVITHNPTGREFEVVCNGNAQWTILGIDIGTYTVEEVADGFTFVYDTENNVSRVIMETPYSRVTKYAVTDDDEEKGLTKYGAGGENFRKVFSADVSELKDLSDKGPQNVKVGDISVPNDTHTETVQVCNYYSKPIGPIQVTKNLIGGTVNESTEFKFTLTPIGFTVRDSAGNNVVLPSGDDVLSQPMPIRVETDDKGKIISTTAEPTATVTLDKDTSTAVATFESIPFRFEGTYYYTITEENTGINGIKYDPKTYYVEVVVEKKYTQFIKDYTYEKGMTHPAKYTEYTKIDNEDFYYLGANIRYATDEKFQNVVAECELYLGYNPNTGKPDVKEFQIAYKEGTGVNDVAFNNEITGNLTAIKKWFDKDSNLNPENHTELSLYIQNRVVGTDDWNLYKEIKLSSGNLTQDRNWKYVETNLPLIDESGNPLEYRVVEPDSYRALYSISYSYNGTDYYANQCDNDPDYAMSLRDGDDGSKTFGEVTITNKTVTINELPSTGGMGTAPLIALGALLISMAVSGFILYKKKETI
jgi:LPXTG-motif cell wall-anchored protein